MRIAVPRITVAAMPGLNLGASPWCGSQSELITLRDDRPEIRKAKDEIESGQQADRAEQQDGVQIGL
jgi:hypothetical protein